MRFNNHSWLEDTHATFGASNPAWLNYDEEKMIRVAHKMEATRRGTKMHEYAKQAIELGIRQAESKKTLNQYINDAIGYRLKPEVILFANPFFYGTADAIGFRQGLLRIQDLKTGITPAHFQQLEIYAAFFCIEYEIKPVDIEIVMAIYQNDEVAEIEADPLVITNHMSTTNLFGEILAKTREEADS